MAGNFVTSAMVESMEELIEVIGATGMGSISGDLVATLAYGMGSMEYGYVLGFVLVETALETIGSTSMPDDAIGGT